MEYYETIVEPRRGLSSGQGVQWERNIFTLSKIYLSTTGQAVNSQGYNSLWSSKHALAVMGCQWSTVVLLILALPYKRAREIIFGWVKLIYVLRWG